MTVGTQSVLMNREMTYSPEREVTVRISRTGNTSYKLHRRYGLREEQRGRGWRPRRWRS